MGEENFWDRVRDAVGGAAFRVFLWAHRMTEGQYFEHIWEVEQQRRDEEREAHGK